MSSTFVHLSISENFASAQDDTFARTHLPEPSWSPPSPFRPLPAPLPHGQTGDAQESAILPPVARIGAVVMQAQAEVTVVEGSEEDDVEAPREGVGVMAPLQQRRA